MRVPIISPKVSCSLTFSVCLDPAFNYNVVFGEISNVCLVVISIDFVLSVVINRPLLLLHLIRLFVSVYEDDSTLTQSQLLVSSLQSSANRTHEDCLR